MVLSWRLRDWGTLPEPGGYFDQPLDVMKRVEIALYTYNCFTARNSARKAADFAKNNPRIVEYCAQVERWAEEEN